MSKERGHAGRSSPLERLWPDEDRPLTVDELLRQPEDGGRYELVGGVLHVYPPPRLDHQQVLSRLISLVGRACIEDFEAVTGVGINLAGDLHRVADLVVMRAPWTHPTS